MIHIEDLFAAFQQYQIRAIRIRSASIREPGTWEREMALAQAEFKAICDAAGLQIDWEPR